MFKNTGLKNSVIEELIVLAKKYHLERLVLFCSCAMKSYDKNKD